MSLVYKITNNINKKIYIGCTSRTAECRFAEHKRTARHNPCACVLYKAIKKYGEEAFSIEVLEDDLTEEEAYIREGYYIESLSSHYSTGKGYNMAEGGNRPPIPAGEKNFMAKLTEEEVEEIRNLLIKSRMSYPDIAKQYSVDRTTIERIQSGIMWYNDTYDYPLRKIRANEQVALDIMKLLATTTLTNREIGELCGVGEDIPSRINTGKRYSYLYSGEYPIRKRN